MGQDEQRNTRWLIVILASVCSFVGGRWSSPDCFVSAAISCDVSGSTLSAGTLCAVASKDDETTVCLPLASGHVPSRGGGPVVVAHHVGDWITHGTQTKGNYLKALASLFQDALAHDGLGTSAEGKLVLDIGGNIGLFTTIALSHGARVETFEPGTKNRKKMATTFFANGFNLVTVNPIGLGAESTPMMTYFDPASPVYNSDGVVVSGPDDPLITELRNQKEGTPAASRSCCEWYLEPVLISTLDIANTNNKLAGTYFVKIDVEGFESLVFDGGKDFFRNVHPNYVFFEVNWSLWHSRREMPHWRSVQDTVAFLEENGYEVYEAEDYFKNKRRIRPEHAVKPKNNNNPDYLAVYRG